MKTPDTATENNVGRKTPEEIKKGLEVCSMGSGCSICPYEDFHICRGIENKADALAYIQ